MKPEKWSDPTKKLFPHQVGFTGPPVLLGGGVLKAGSLAGIRLLNAPPNALVLASLSLAPYPLEAYGGGLTATPSAFQMLAFADGTGQLLAGLTWPPGFAPGTGIYFQCLIADPTVPWGITLSNALKGTTE